MHERLSHMNMEYSHKTELSFDEQVKNLHYLDSKNGSIIEFVELKPNQQESEVPIILLGGMATDIRTVKKAAHTIFNQDRRVVAINFPISQEVSEKVIHDDIHPFHSQKAEQLIEVIDNIKSEKVDIIARSEASLYATAAALREPQAVRNLIVFAGSGLTGRDSYLALLTRFGTDISKIYNLRHPNQSKQYSQSLFEYVLKTPFKEIKQELNAIAVSSIDKSLQIVKQNGVKVVVVQAKSDLIYKPPKIENHVNVIDAYNSNANVYLSLADKKANHGSLLFSEDTAIAAVDIIRNLENPDFSY
jgi:pimeloyl-ACP methyl ester carboxylesterase